MLRLGPRNWAAGFEGRRWFSSGAPDMPLAAAANAAMLLAAVELMLFLRVTRWAGFIEAADSECECGRDLGSEPAMELEWRCWVEGRTAMGSCGRRSSQQAIDCEFKGITCLEDSHGGRWASAGPAFFVRQGKRGGRW